MAPNMHADDTCVSVAAESLSELINNPKDELESTLNWIRKNKPSLNASKSEPVVLT